MFVWGRDWGSEAICGMGSLRGKGKEKGRRSMGTEKGRGPFRARVVSKVSKHVALARGI